MEVSGQLHAQAALPPEKNRLASTEYEGLWVPEKVWTLWRRDKLFEPDGSRTMIPQKFSLQPNHYND
jgi:hypothetical protein